MNRTTDEVDGTLHIVNGTADKGTTDKELDKELETTDKVNRTTDIGNVNGTFADSKTENETEL